MVERYKEGKPDIVLDNPLARTLLQKLDYDQLTNCMRCGFCLPACPTFQETGLEPESPRGRIALMKAVADGLMAPDERFREQMNHCLGCRACEPVCPADVKYGRLIEQARDAIEDHPQHTAAVSCIRTLVFRHLFPHERRMKRLGGLLRFYQRSGVQAAVRMIGLLRILPKHLREMEAVLPEASSNGVADRIGTFLSARGEPIARVGLFRGCIMDVLFTETNVNTAKLLAEAGFEVVVPTAQGCCGALHAHSGETDTARELARRNVQAFKDANVDYIVSNAGGCGAILVEYDHLLEGDSAVKEDAISFAKRVKDVSQLVVDKGRLPDALDAADSQNHPEPVRITYQDSCHLRNVMKTGDAPRQLMKRIAGTEFVEMEQSDRCCGSAGIYNVTNPEMAGQILERKMGHANETNPRYLLTSNPGCLLQMKLGVERHKPRETLEVMHIVDFLYSRLRRSE
ncbi:(Fe-S)-binding protein [Paenibacillus alkalitolerans]|uniref:(Fe-S)-binding protein n=1 Tax=Paenibacillus alkalitolerans TaxID=2799335 RepID=UPI0018F5E266|nr:(Fe-S)-binding protein [Paenibacillus alkalitolerans]